ncbi:hypothetical protein D3C71_1637960 [compost metagenome]
MRPSASRSRKELRSPKVVILRSGLSWSEMTTSPRTERTQVMAKSATSMDDLVGKGRPWKDGILVTTLTVSGANALKALT